MKLKYILEQSDNEALITNFRNHIKSKYGDKVEDFHIMPYMKDTNDIKLYSLMIPKEYRKQGIGSSVMEDLCLFADQHQFRIILDVATRDDHMGTTSKNRLIKFYKKFDFVLNKGRRKDFRINATMYRKPQ